VVRVTDGVQLAARAPLAALPERGRVYVILKPGGCGISP
jgi:hypothetical protein